MQGSSHACQQGQARWRFLAAHHQVLQINLCVCAVVSSKRFCLPARNAAQAVMLLPLPSQATAERQYLAISNSLLPLPVLQHSSLHRHAAKLPLPPQVSAIPRVTPDTTSHRPKSIWLCHVAWKLYAAASRSTIGPAGCISTHTFACASRAWELIQLSLPVTLNFSELSSWPHETQSHWQQASGLNTVSE